MMIEVRKDYIEIDGVPRFIFGGDFSYGRAWQSDWRDSLNRIKSAGMNTVSLYVPWLFHEPREGEWDFNGNHDLARLLDLAAEIGLWVILRLGPFVHSEYRNGGLPQWLLDKLGDRVRTNDPEYLKYTGMLYEKIIEMARPRQITRNGPVILLQLENELGSAGCKGDDIARGSTNPEENIKHVLHYFELVRAQGMDIPLIDINNIPDKENLMDKLCDSGGGYPVNCFGTDGELWGFSTDKWDNHTRPWVSIETGAGMFARYYDVPPYRNTNGFQGPLVEASMVEAYIEQNIAEGANGVNTFVLFDGYNFNDSAESMLPKQNFNYQAPVSCVGTLRDSYKAIKRIGWFIRSFEQNILKSTPNGTWATVASYGLAHPGVELGEDLFDGYGKDRKLMINTPAPVENLSRTTTGLNLSESNFIFMRNVKHHGTHWKRDIRVGVTSGKLACEVSQEYPKRVQMELPPGSCKIMPFFIKLDEGYFLEYSTATLLDKRKFGEQIQVICHASAEEIVETRFLSKFGNEIQSADFLGLEESPCGVMLIGTPENRIKTAEFNGHIRYVLLSTDFAGNVWDFAGDVMLTDLSIVESTDHSITVVTDRSDFYIELLSPARKRIEGAEWQYDDVRKVNVMTGHFELPEPDIAWRQSRRGNDIELSVPVEPRLLDGLENLVIDLTFDGSFGEAYLDDRLISDHVFGKFMKWEIGLGGFLQNAAELIIICRDTRKVDYRLRHLMRKTLHFN